MELDSFEIIELELKYCECCGGLWLRECGSQHVYCEPSSAVMQQVPSPRKRGPRPRLPIAHRPSVLAAPSRAYYCEGGNA